MTTINLQKGLVGQWTMDDAHLDSGASQIKDSSGNGNHGDLQGGVSTGQPSPVGESFLFDATDDVVNCGNAPETRPTTEMTVAALVKPQNVVGSNDGGENFSCVSVNNGYILRFEEYGNARLFVYDDGTSGYFKASLSLNVGDVNDRWSWLIGDYDQTQIGVYFEGFGGDVLEQSTSPNTDVTDDMQLGAYQNNTVDGYVSNVLKWDRKITAAERQALYNMTARRRAQI